MPARRPARAHAARRVEKPAPLSSRDARDAMKMLSSAQGISTRLVNFAVIATPVSAPAVTQRIVRGDSTARTRRRSAAAQSALARLSLLRARRDERELRQERGEPRGQQRFRGRQHRRRKTVDQKNGDRSEQDRDQAQTMQRTETPGQRRQLLRAVLVLVLVRPSRTRGTMRCGPAPGDGGQAEGLSRRRHDDVIQRRLMRLAPRFHTGHGEASFRREKVHVAGVPRLVGGLERGHDEAPERRADEEEPDENADGKRGEPIPLGHAAEYKRLVAGDNSSVFCRMVSADGAFCDLASSDSSRFSVVKSPHPQPSAMM